MKIRYIPIILCAGSIALYCCTKVQEGFLSDHFAYRPNPFIATQGGVSVSNAMDADGSTMPLQVKLLEIRNKRTGTPLDSEILKAREVVTFTGEILTTDTTLELLNKKIAKSTVRPFTINATGGRIQLSPASAYIDTGAYTIDVQVANVRGTKVLKDICEVRLQPKKYYEIFRQTLSASTPGDESSAVGVPDGVSLTVERIPDGPNKVFVKFKDKNGAFFNPVTDIIKRGDLNQFGNFNPYYPELKTDTALIYEYPNVPAFPVYKLNGGYDSYYRIPYTKNDMGRNINPTFSVAFYAPGTWILTMQITAVAKL